MSVWLAETLEVAFLTQPFASTATAPQALGAADKADARFENILGVRH
jgi:hypothetical protein